MKCATKYGSKDIHSLASDYMILDYIHSGYSRKNFGCCHVLQHHVKHINHYYCVFVEVADQAVGDYKCTPNQDRKREHVQLVEQVWMSLVFCHLVAFLSFGRAGVVGTDVSDMVVESSMSIIMKRTLSGVDALSIWIDIVLVCPLWSVLIEGRMFLFMSGLSD
ncbi:unnamed protein product [Lactuca virosa]|uniref:Uncharacterized protein n=1 Tax=Lactuca virosa TaxID=75947 RepID=A0AAU9PLJ5_9ASTR|nr:unnamed protein product [Lactuca virosa]